MNSYTTEPHSASPTTRNFDMNTPLPTTTSQLLQHQIEEKVEEVVDIVPPSPPPAPPSGLAVAMARLTDLNCQIEYQYAKHLQLTEEHELAKAKYELLKKLPIGVEALREDINAMNGKDEENEKSES